MRAVVLVGGEGTRLRPVTYQLPKQLLPVAGVPLLRHVLRPLEAVDVDEVVLSLCYRSDAFADAQLGPLPVRSVVEDEPLGSGGGLAHATRSAGLEGTFIALNGDVMGDVDVAALLDLHHRSGASATMLVTPVADPSEFGVAVVGAAGVVEEFVEKPGAAAPSNLINAGVWILETAILDQIASGGRCNIEREIFAKLAAVGQLRALRHDSWWYDVGRLDRYLAATAECLARAIVPDDWSLEDGVLTAPGADVADGARVTRSVIGMNTAVEAEAVIDGSVLMDGASVARKASVRDSLVGPAWRVGEAEAVTDRILARPTS